MDTKWNYYNYISHFVVNNEKIERKKTIIRYCFFKKITIIYLYIVDILVMKKCKQHFWVLFFLIYDVNIKI
jgi:hypothetical protein